MTALARTVQVAQDIQRVKIVCKILSFEMFDRTTSRNFLPPRRQDRKEKIFSRFRTWRALRLCASHLFSDSASQYSTENFKYVWLGLLCKFIAFI